MFPFSVILKSILKILIYPNLNHYRHSVSILPSVESLSVLSARNKNQSLDVVSPFFIFVFKFFYEYYKEFLVSLIVRPILAINEKSEKFWYGVNDKVWGSVGGGEGKMSREVSVG